MLAASFKILPEIYNHASSLEAKHPRRPHQHFRLQPQGPESFEGDCRDVEKALRLYHKKHWGYDKLFRDFQHRNLFCNVVAGKAIISSAVAGAITLNPVVFATLTGFGLMVKGVKAAKVPEEVAKKWLTKQVL